ncbi:MAG: DoxX family membrane protein, partial [Rudaea sp.]
MIATTRATFFDGWGHPLFALAMIGLGAIGLYSGDFASVWQHMPIENMPGRSFLAYLAAIIELLAGIAILFRPTIALASRVLLVFLSLWLVALKIPGVVTAPLVEAMWLGFGEIAVMVAGAWIIVATHSGRNGSRFLTGPTGVRNARILFAIALPMIGLSHFVYVDETMKFVPAWIPAPQFWAYLTGAGSLLACLGILSGVFARLAAALEAAMLVIITPLVWTPWLTPAPVNQFQLTGFLISSAIACGAWIVADSYRARAWLGRTTV